MLVLTGIGTLPLQTYDIGRSIRESQTTTLQVLADNFNASLDAITETIEDLSRSPHLQQLMAADERWPAPQA